MTPQEKSILEKNISGINGRMLISLVVTVLSIIGGSVTISIYGNNAYNGIMNAIRDGDKSNQVQDTQIKALQLQIDILRIDVRDLEREKSQNH